MITCIMAFGEKKYCILQTLIHFAFEATEIYEVNTTFTLVCFCKCLNMCVALQSIFL